MTTIDDRRLRHQRLWPLIRRQRWLVEELRQTALERAGVVRECAHARERQDGNVAAAGMRMAALSRGESFSAARLDQAMAFWSAHVERAGRLASEEIEARRGLEFATEKLSQEQGKAEILEDSAARRARQAQADRANAYARALEDMTVRRRGTNVR